MYIYLSHFFIFLENILLYKIIDFTKFKKKIYELLTLQNKC